MAFILKVWRGNERPRRLNAKIMTELMNYQKPGKPDVIADFIMKWGIWIFFVLAGGFVLGAWLCNLL